MTVDKRVLEDYTHTTVMDLIAWAGGDVVAHPDLRKTPYRLAMLFQKYFNVQRPSIALFPNHMGDGAIVRSCNYVSICAHHLIPFSGKVHVGYCPSKKILGLRKIDQIVRYYARKLQVQEMLTKQIGDYLVDVLKPKGLLVILTGRHFCCILKGDNGDFTTSKAYGIFRKDTSLKLETLRLMGL